MGCELRKEKTRCRRFEVATERLLMFIEVDSILQPCCHNIGTLVYVATMQECHDALVKTPEADRIM